MPNISSKTRPIAFRISIEAHTIAERRAEKQGIKVGKYLSKRVEYDLRRKH